MCTERNNHSLKLVLIGVFAVSSIMIFYELGVYWFSILIASIITLLILLLYQYVIKIQKLELEAHEINLLKEQYESFIDDVPIAICFIIGRKIKYANKTAIKMLGIGDLKEILNKSVFDYIPKEFLEHVIHEEGGTKDKRKRKQGNTVGLLKKKCGDTLDVNIQYQQLYFKNSWGYGVVIKDITDLKNSQKQLQHSEQLSVIGELAAGVAHEIRNPLTSLKGFLQLISHECKKAASYQEIMASELERINLIVNELLLLSKPREVDFESSHILHLIKTVVTIANTQAILHKIQIKLKYNEEIEQVFVRCEENKLKQVFLNLLKNAMEAMEWEGDIYIKFKQQEGRIYIQFIDEGPGISNDKLDQLGKRFYTTKPDGTGLGLMISMNIIREHSGEMHITSEEGVGTKVEVNLPVIKN